jgi:dipeptidyl aminopeptidase/acylaminoacyl peptidase
MAYGAVGGAVRTHTDAAETAARNIFYLYCRQQGLWPREVAGHDPVTEPAVFVPFCPAHNVGADYPPTLLLHGDQDTDVPYAQSVQMAEALQRVGVEHDLLTYAGGPHAYDQDMEDAIVAAQFARLLTFLSRHV